MSEDVCDLEEEFGMRLDELSTEMILRGLKIKHISVEYYEKELEKKECGLK